MTILDSYQRRQERRSIIRGPISAIKHSWKFTKKLENRIRLPSAAPAVEPATVAAMKREVMELLSGNNNSSSSKTTTTTVWAMASALATSKSVLTVHAGGAGGFMSNQRSSFSQMDKIRYNFSRLGMSPAKSQEVIERRYALVQALNKLEFRTNSSQQLIHTWEEAYEVLSTVISFPKGETPLQQQQQQLSVVVPQATQQQKKKTNAVEKLIERQQERILTKIGLGTNWVSEQKWKQIRATPVPPKLREEERKQEQEQQQQQQQKDEAENISPEPPIQVDNKAKVSSASSTQPYSDDSSLRQQLEQAYEKHDARLASTVSAEVEKRMIQKEEEGRLERERLEREKREEEARSRASSLMRPLNDEEQDLVKYAMYGMGPEDEVIAEVGTDSVQRGSMHRLQPGQWLNDEVIHYFYVMLSKRDEELSKADPSRKRSHFFKSFFITKLLNEGNANPALDGKYEYKNVKRWGKKVPGGDMFALDKIFFPINQGRMHWLCAVAYMTEKRIQVYDSMGRGSDDTYYAEQIFRYIQDEHQAKKKKPLPDIDDWNLYPCSEDTPQQRNGFDCGVFTCMFADFLSKDCPLVFSQEHVTQCRERIALSIMNGSAII